MHPDGLFYFGNAALDQVRGTGWFIGQFIPAELGLRHQAAVELKWGLHPHGERRLNPWAQGHGTTIAILFRGTLNVEFHSSPTSHTVTLEREGDYVVYGPTVAHSWEAIGETLVLTVRFPSIELNQRLQL
jgi:hypothetical protein